MTPIYIDTSAYLAVILRESGWQKIHELMRVNTLCTSAILFIEAERALVHLNRLRRIDDVKRAAGFAQLVADTPVFNTRDFTLDLCLTQNFPVVKTPRSADLIHLRTADRYRHNGGLKMFLTLDDDMRQAAQEMNLPVAPDMH